VQEKDYGFGRIYIMSSETKLEVVDVNLGSQCGKVRDGVSFQRPRWGHVLHSHSFLEVSCKGQCSLMTESEGRWFVHAALCVIQFSRV
jgi:hypothetical protein